MRTRLTARARPDLGPAAEFSYMVKPIQFNPATSLATSLTASHDFGGMQAGSTVYANAGLNHSLGVLGMVALNYSFTSDPVGWRLPGSMDRG